MFAQMKVLMERLGFVATSAGFEFRKDVSIAGTLTPAVVVIPKVETKAAVLAIDPPIPGQLVFAEDDDLLYIAIGDEAGAASWKTVDVSVVNE